MKLFYRASGNGRPVIIVHGLYGSSDNWVGFTKYLPDGYEIILIDQRNHGQSPHDPDHSYLRMSDDLLEFIESNLTEKPVLIGHSMGGRAVMTFARRFPGMLSGMVVLDVAPKQYHIADNDSEEGAFHRKILQTLKSINPASLESRKEAENLMQKQLGSERVVQFLLKNLQRTPSGNYSWKFNIDAISNHFREIFETDADQGDKPANDKLPALFIRGEKSNYLVDKDMQQILTLFPGAGMETIADAGHWLHAEQPEALSHTIKDFLFRHFPPGSHQ